MAVKVMVAPAIATGEVHARKPRQPGAAPKARRRRSSVYDADGREVFITLLCLKCHKMRPLSQFGLRKMADGAIRNQPWCRACRSGAGAENPRRKGGTDGEGAPEPLPATAATGDPTSPANGARPLSAGTLADQVAAAIVWGK
jgi:hypothetical protein